MSKIAENKARKAYPNALIGNLDNLKKDGFIKGYDQAMQDLYDRDMQKILKKAEKWIEKHIEMFSWVHCDSEGNEEWRNDFKNYMQKEEQ